jgi:multidrug efflux pump subunit AcrA (membrane-fusion protein)
MKEVRWKAKAGSLAAAVCAASLCAAFGGGCEKAKSDPAAEAPPAATVEQQNDLSLVKVDKPERFPLVEAAAHEATSQLDVTGSVNPDVSREIPVVTIASGRVVAIHVRLGDFVHKGQLIMEVQSTDISGAFDQYLKAVNDEHLANTQLERAKILYEKGAIAKSQLEIAQDGEDDAAAACAWHRQGPSRRNGEGLFAGIGIHHPAECDRGRDRGRGLFWVGDRVYDRRHVARLDHLRRL